MAIAAMASMPANTHPPAQAQTRARGARTKAEKTRRAVSPSRELPSRELSGTAPDPVIARSASVTGRDRAETALAAVELGNGSTEMLGREVGPEHIVEVKF